MKRRGVLPAAYGVAAVLSVYREGNACEAADLEYERALISKAADEVIRERMRKERREVAEASARIAEERLALAAGWEALRAMQKVLGEPGDENDPVKLSQDVKWLRENNRALSAALKWQGEELERLRG